MLNLPLYIPIVFGITTLLTIWFFYRAAQWNKTVVYVLIAWLVLQAVVALTGFYTETRTVPPRFLFLVALPVLVIILLFITRKGKEFIDKLDIEFLTLLHVVRVPVEIVLFWLFTYKAIPELMTFEGRNFDIISGITAPLVYYYGFTTKGLSKRMMIIWNFICLGLLFNIVMHAIFAVPTNFQKLAFDQPNIGVLYFPFIWLPCCVVPLVLLAHLVSIRKLWRSSVE